MVTTQQLNVSETRYNFRTEGDFAIYIPTNEIKRLEEMLRSVADLRDLLPSFEEKGFIRDYVGNRPGQIEVSMYRLGNQTCVNFSNVDEAGKVRLLQIARISGIDMPH